MLLTISNSRCQPNAYNKQKRHHSCRLRIQMKQSLNITYDTTLRYNCRKHAHLFVLVAQLPSRRRIEAIAHAQKSLAHCFGSTNHWLEYGDGHGANHSFERPLVEVCQFSLYSSITITETYIISRSLIYLHGHRKNGLRSGVHVHSTKNN